MKAKLTDKTAIVAIAKASYADIIPAATKESDGTLTFARINVGRDAPPPM